MDTETKINLNEWLEGDYDRESKLLIQHLMENNPEELVDAFYKKLSFGTGGLRGIMGVGTNRINCYTVRAATQGIANYVAKHSPPGHIPRFIVGYDSRRNSYLFATETAKVLAANNIEVFLFDKLCTTPIVSFGCRLKHCNGGIMITASHNPPEYNGYKVYWRDGGQVLPPHDHLIIDEVNAITNLSMVKVSDNINHPLIHIVGGEILKAYYNVVTPLQNFPESNQKNGNDLKVVYSNLHGTGITMIPETLNRWGFTNLTLVEEQSAPDGDFPTVNYPNPEDPKALQLGIKKLAEIQGDLLIATDPDADRVGVAVAHKGEYRLLNGNEIACICLEHLCSALQTQGRLPANGAFIKTVVTTELFQAIAEAYHRPCFNVLTGFKYIAELIGKWEKSGGEYQFIFGGEESYGYLLGTQTRDKDGIIASALICEAALHAKLFGKTLVDRLYDIYRQYGLYTEKVHALTFPESKQGHEKMELGMKKLQDNPPKEIAGIPVEIIDDYALSVKKHLATGKEEVITLPKTNLMIFWLSDKSKIMVRPSGTEPKVKIYCGVVKRTHASIIDETKLLCEEQCQKLIDATIAIIQ